MLFASYNSSTEEFTIGGHANEFISNELLTSLLTHVRTSKGDNALNALTSVNYQTGASSGLKTQATLTFGE